MTLWGGRFTDEPGAGTWEFTTDESDRRLLVVDVQGSIAHVEMLGKTGIVSNEEASVLSEGLAQIEAEASSGEFRFMETDEDVHTAVERRLHELVGDVAGKLHTGRSRNDQVALDLRLYLLAGAGERARDLRGWAGVLADRAEEHADIVIPSYTHLQQAQPSTLGHHLLAHAWAAIRSAERFEDASNRIGRSPLGAGAAAGSSLPIDSSMTADALGLESVMPNSLDAVGSRDFVAEYVFCCAQAMTELSRLAEEIVLWSSREFGWVVLGDDVSTGSSALPQKRNPDVAELVRGRAATVSADVVAILSLQKALPLAYNRDLQEDKRIVFHADDTLAMSLRAMAELINGIRFDPPPPGAETVALDLAESLVSRGVPFREAHGIVGRLVAVLENSGRSLDEATIEDMTAIDDRFDPEDLERLDPARSVSGRTSAGSPNADSVAAQVAAVRSLAE